MYVCFCSCLFSSFFSACFFQSKFQERPKLLEEIEQLQGAQEQQNSEAQESAGSEATVTGGSFLVGGDWNMNGLFFHSVGNHPNWRTHIFPRGRYTTHQILSGWWLEHTGTWMSDECPFSWECHHPTIPWDFMRFSSEDVNHWRIISCLSSR